jgi:hypothetical protein
MPGYVTTMPEDIHTKTITLLEDQPFLTWESVKLDEKKITTLFLPTSN